MWLVLAKKDSLFFFPSLVHSHSNSIILFQKLLIIWHTSKIQGLKYLKSTQTKPYHDHDHDQILKELIGRMRWLYFKCTTIFFFFTVGSRELYYTSPTCCCCLISCLGVMEVVLWHSMYSQTLTLICTHHASIFLSLLCQDSSQIGKEEEMSETLDMDDGRHYIIVDGCHNN